MMHGSKQSLRGRLRPARRWLIGGALLGIGALVGLGAVKTTASVDPNLHLEAALAARRLYVASGDDTIGSYPIAVGKDSKPTPAGNYRIRKIVWNPAWIPPDEKWAKGKTPEAPGSKKNPMKLVKIFFKEPDYYIHGTSEVESLGDAASHGCLRMAPDDAYTVARYLMEHGGQPRDESWFWRVLHFRSESQTVYLDHPIPIAIRY